MGFEKPGIQINNEKFLLKRSQFFQSISKKLTTREVTLFPKRTRGLTLLPLIDASKAREVPGLVNRLRGLVVAAAATEKTAALVGACTFRGFGLSKPTQLGYPEAEQTLKGRMHRESNGPKRLRLSMQLQVRLSQG